MNPVITLITDYGCRDHYVGAVKGVILGLAPEARIVDITHEIEPHQITPAAFLLRQIWSWFPPGTIHLVVVDPGVGGKRRIIVGRYDGRYLVAPDNGLISFVHRELVCEALHTVRDHRPSTVEPSATFHGRDIMGPVAADLALGAQPREFGPATDEPVLLEIEDRAQAVDHGLHGRVLYVDHFGTMVTNVRQEQLAELGDRPGRCEVRVNDTPIGAIHRTFSDVAMDEPVALLGSSGFLEIAINQGRAIDRFGPAERVHVDVHRQ